MSKDLDNIVDREYLVKNGINKGDYNGKYEAVFNKALDLNDNFNFSLSLKEFESLAEKGDVDSQINAATILESNPRLINKDKAIYWYNKAIASGSIKATGALGELYRKSGEFNEALKLLKKASLSGDRDACIGLSMMYWAGEGVTQDSNEAIILMENAAKKSPNFMLPHSNLFKYYITVNNDEKAKNSFLKATEISPEFTLEMFEVMMNDLVESQISDYLNGGYSATASDQTIYFQEWINFCKPIAEKHYPEEVTRISSEAFSYRMDREDELVGVMKANRTKRNLGCFIATEVYEDYDAYEVLILRSFRDKKLLKTNFGRKFVSFYYKYSPRVAGFLRKNPALKIPVKYLFLDPVVRIIKRVF